MSGKITFNPKKIQVEVIHTSNIKLYHVNHPSSLPVLTIQIFPLTLVALPDEHLNGVSKNTLIAT